MKVSALKICAIANLALIQTANAADQGKINQTIDVIEEFCLSGKSYDFKASAMGTITLRGPKGTIEANVKKTSGGVGYFNESIRKEVDDATRICMQPYVNKVIQLINEP